MITTHVLDLREGRPAAGLQVTLERQEGERWEPLGAVTTDAQGRAGPAVAGDGSGVYRLRFGTGPYWGERGVDALHPEVVVTFRRRPGESLHLPLLLSPFGYTTYRGT
ncbi:MAG: hydroxyisourate hydrolase [Candidatus Dormibacteraceae bacterium]